MRLRRVPAVLAVAVLVALCTTQQPQPAPQTGHRGLPKPLVISTTNAPATPYASGVNLARDLKGALLTYEGAQHTVFLDGALPPAPAAPSPGGARDLCYRRSR
ncbi:alpha/beta hydrolase [Amycolatopsis sp. NPDC051071]|uniref:alpha/beta hydrolase n=1 Tax=Amycolatopsis sp. NPDC051071 TaxID=3154637 RepID=UPI00341D9B69